MANIFASGEELLNKKDFDDKVNVDSNIYSEVFDSYDISQVIGTTPHSGMKLLKVFRDNSTFGGITAGANGSGIAFGGEDTAAVISVNGWGQHIARITWQNSDKSRLWYEDIAWKSDIAELKQEIADLKKQIGGVLSSALSHLRQRIEVVA